MPVVVRREDTKPKPAAKPQAAARSAKGSPGSPVRTIAVAAVAVVAAALALFSVWRTLNPPKLHPVPPSPYGLAAAPGVAQSRQATPPMGQRALQDMSVEDGGEAGLLPK
jgi:hypothetical protein